LYCACFFFLACGSSEKAGKSLANETNPPPKATTPVDHDVRNRPDRGAASPPMSPAPRDAAPPSPEESEAETPSIANDPYLGELKGRLFSAWNHPSAASRAGAAQACIRLAADGSVVETAVKPGSNQALNRSVADALKNIGKMSGPVPSHLHDLLVK